MNDLIARLEKATGPDYRLSQDIGAAINLPCHYRYEHPGSENQSWKHYTASIDAALALVPDGAGLRLDRYWLRDREAWTAVASTGGVPSNPARQFEAEDAHTLALALCIAGLKARSHHSTAGETKA